ncbi:hypothetical protein MHU86_4756 [Fragilaria crotonensis]|nr:hypothetical protein MHU86_4756 [Fragilaria crotonensis]
MSGEAHVPQPVMGSLQDINSDQDGHLNAHPMAASTDPSSRLQHAQVLWQSIFRRDRLASSNDPPPRRATILSRRNARTNTHWGDPLLNKRTDCTRIYSANVNGIHLDHRGGQYDDICKTIKEVDADLFCGQEINLDTCQYAVKQALYDTTNQHWERARIIFGSSPISFNSYYKPGGTMMVTNRDLTGRVSNQASDKWGRWVSQDLQGNNGRTIAVFSCYQVIYKQTQLGYTTAASQQHNLLLRQKDPLTDPRRAFKRDLHEALRKKISRNGTLTSR